MEQIMSGVHEEHAPECTCGCHDHVHDRDRGHERAHDRGREHGHGHAHAHEREHEHGHAHNHARNREHNHDHDHEHVRECMIDLGWARATLESHVHDQASTVSATISAQADSSKPFEALADALQVVAREAEAAGAVVGHIKGYARADGSFARASATDGQHAPACEGDVRLSLGSDSTIQLVAIVMLIGLDDLEHIVTNALKAL